MVDSNTKQNSQRDPKPAEVADTSNPGTGNVWARVKASLCYIGSLMPTSRPKTKRKKERGKPFNDSKSYGEKKASPDFTKATEKKKSQP